MGEIMKNEIQELYAHPVKTLSDLGPKWATQLFDVAQKMPQGPERTIVFEMASNFRDMCKLIPAEEKS